MDFVLQLVLVMFMTTMKFTQLCFTYCAPQTLDAKILPLISLLAPFCWGCLYFAIYNLSDTSAVHLMIVELVLCFRCVYKILACSVVMELSSGQGVG